MLILYGLFITVFEAVVALLEDDYVCDVAKPRRCVASYLLDVSRDLVQQLLRLTVLCAMHQEVPRVCEFEEGIELELVVSERRLSLKKRSAINDCNVSTPAWSYSRGWMRRGEEPLRSRKLEVHVLPFDTSPVQMPCE